MIEGGVVATKQSVGRSIPRPIASLPFVRLTDSVGLGVLLNQSRGFHISIAPSASQLRHSIILHSPLLECSNHIWLTIPRIAWLWGPQSGADGVPTSWVVYNDKRSACNVHRKPLQSKTTSDTFKSLHKSCDCYLHDGRFDETWKFKSSRNGKESRQREC